MRIAICFFGITRSLRYTFPSIEANVLAPARGLGDVRVYSHFFRQQTIGATASKPYTGSSVERGTVDPDEYRLLDSHWIAFDEPDAEIVTCTLDQLKPFGDFWNNDFVSLRNLVHQLHSLRCVTRAMQQDAPCSAVLFCRPDLRYHDSLSRALKSAASRSDDFVLAPKWQSWTGVNDRFAICSPAAATAYGLRIEQAIAYCRAVSGPLHSERLLQYALRKADIPVGPISARASRVRVDGTERWEDFAHPLISRLRRRLHTWKRALAG